MEAGNKRLQLREILAGAEGVIAPGVTEPIFAQLAQDTGYSVIHLSGNAFHKSFCLPDRDLLTVTEIASRAARIADVTDIPLIVDVGGRLEPIQVARAVRVLEGAGVAAIRLEDSYLVPSTAGAPPATAIHSKDTMIDKIKAATDSRSDTRLVLIARCDARESESYDSVEDRLTHYAAAGADALGVQLSKLEEFSNIARNPPKPLVSLWPRNRMSAFEFLRLGFRVALMPSGVTLTAVAAVREMLTQLRKSGTERNYFACVPNMKESEDWYRALGGAYYKHAKT
jgi:methylisocitrate lyase